MENKFNLVELGPHKNLNFSRCPTPLSALSKTLNGDFKKMDKIFWNIKTPALESDQFGLNLFLFRHNVINSVFK